MKRKIGLLMAILALFVIAFVGCGKDKNTENAQTITNPSSEVLSNIKSEYVITKDGKAAIKLTNNNNENVQFLEVNVTYSDEKGNLLSSDTQIVMHIGANSEFILASFLPYNDENTIYPSSVKVNVSKLDAKGVEIQNDKLGIKHNKSQTGNVIIECTNNYEKAVDAQVNIIYYKGKNIVGCDSESYTLNSKETKSAEFYRPADEESAEIEFDTYKLYYSVISADESISQELENVAE